MARFVYLSVVLLLIASDAAAQSREQIARGKYVFGAAAGCGCHTVPKQALNAGGAQVRRAVRHRLRLEYHAGSHDRNRQVDGRADHHRGPGGAAAER